MGTSTQLLVDERARAGQFSDPGSRQVLNGLLKGVGGGETLAPFILFSNFRNSSMLSPEAYEKGFCFGFVSLSGWPYLSLGQTLRSQGMGRN